MGNTPVNPNDSSPGFKSGGVPGGSFKAAGANVKTTKYASESGKPAMRGNGKKAGMKKGY